MCINKVRPNHTSMKHGSYAIKTLSLNLSKFDNNNTRNMYTDLVVDEFLPTLSLAVSLLATFSLQRLSSKTILDYKSSSSL